MALAERHGGTVVNADAMQVYRDLRVLTARPSQADEARVPHALFGHVDGAAAYSVAAFVDDAAAAIAAARAAGRVPVVVGGTGLYLSALVEGLSPVPPVPDHVRNAWRGRQAAMPAEALHAELARRDPVMAARLHPSDPQRIVRALEVKEATGRSLVEWQSERAPPVLAADPRVRRIVLSPPRGLLRGRIEARLEAMIDGGAVAEAEALAARGLDPGLPVMKAIGVAQLADHAAGRAGLDEAVARAVTASRRYAKRQDTWFRHRFADWARFACVEDAIDTAERSPRACAVFPTGARGHSL